MRFAHDIEHAWRVQISTACGLSRTSAGYLKMCQEWDCMHSQSSVPYTQVMTADFVKSVWANSTIVSWWTWDTLGPDNIWIVSISSWTIKAPDSHKTKPSQRTERHQVMLEQTWMLQLEMDIVLSAQNAITENIMHDTQLNGTLHLQARRTYQHICYWLLEAHHNGWSPT